MTIVCLHVECCLRTFLSHIVLSLCIYIYILTTLIQKRHRIMILLYYIYIYIALLTENYTEIQNLQTFKLNKNFGFPFQIHVFQQVIASFVLFLGNLH